MSDLVAGRARAVSVKIGGNEYRIRSEAEPEHLQEVAAYVDRVLREVQERASSDTQAAAILTALNIASDLLRSRSGMAISPARLRGLIDLVDSAREGER